MFIGTTPQRGHSGIAGRYPNLELLGSLFHYFDLKTLILNNFISLAADIIFWVMKSLWKYCKGWYIKRGKGIFGKLVTTPCTCFWNLNIPPHTNSNMWGLYLSKILATQAVCRRVICFFFAHLHIYLITQNMMSATRLTNCLI